MRRRFTVAATAAALLWLPRSDAQDTGRAPVFPGQVDLVTVDVVVADKRGNPVTGLTREDFTLLDESRPQSIASFEAVEVPPPSGAAQPPRRVPVASNAGTAGRTGRTFVLVFDNVHMSPLHARRAKAAVASFLDKGVREGDLVSLLATGGGAWWSTRMQAGRADLLALLKGLDGRRLRDAMSREQVTDFEAMRIHLFQDTLVGARVARRFEQMGVKMREAREARDFREISLPGVNDLLVEARAAEVYQQARSRLLVTLSALERAVTALFGSRGRKALILVSEGFLFDPTLDDFKAVVENARRANVALYFVDTRGLQGLTAAYGAEFGVPVDTRDFGAVMADTAQDAEGAKMLADDTGGFSVRNTNDVGAGMTRIASESQAYYLLGYTPPAVPRDGRFRKIQVKVSRKGLVVRARNGYFAPREAPPTAPKTAAPATAAALGSAAPATPAPTPTPRPVSKVAADAGIQRALDSPFPIDDIRIRMTTFVLDEALLGKARTLVAAEVDAANLDFVEKDGRLVDTLDVLVVAANRETGEYVRRDQKLEMTLLPETRDRLRHAWYSVMQEFELAPGGYQAKMVARDGNSRKLGTLTYEFEVPDLNQLRISTPILTDRVQQPPGQPAPAPVLVARRSFASGARLYCQFDVYGAQKDKATGLPQVTASYILRRADGTTRERVGPMRVVPTSLGRISQLMWLPLEGAEPGDYELELTIKDELAGLERELREPFTVTPPAHAVLTSAPSKP